MRCVALRASGLVAVLLSAVPVPVTVVAVDGRCDPKEPCGNARPVGKSEGTDNQESKWRTCVVRATDRTGRERKPRVSVISISLLVLCSTDSKPGQ